MDTPEFSAGGPPPIITAPTPRPRKSRGWMIAAIILIVLLIFSLFGNLTQFFLQSLSLDRAFRGNSFTMRPAATHCC